MWVFISSRLRQWLVLAVVVPLATTVVHVVREALERRSGQTRVTRSLAQLEGLGQRRRRR